MFVDVQMDLKVLIKNLNPSEHQQNSIKGILSKDLKNNERSESMKRKIFCWQNYNK